MNSTPLLLALSLEPVPERLRPTDKDELWMSRTRWTAQTVGDLERIYPQLTADGLVGLKSDSK